MQPFNESNFDGLVNRWYQAAENHEAGTTFKMKLFDDTERVASTLERLVQEGSRELAKELANVILQSFDSHKIGESEGLIRWIGVNTLKCGNHVKGASKPFHHLFVALQAVDNDTGTLAAPYYIDYAAMNLLESNDASIQGHGHEEQTIPDDFLNLVVHNSVVDKPFKDSIALRQASKKMRQLVATAYRGPLTELKITTADQAIAYAKEFGKELRYLDISGIDFPDSNKLKKLIENLPKLNTFLAQNSTIDKGGAEAIASSKYMQNLLALDLRRNQIGPAGAKDIASSEFMKNLTALDLSWNQIGPAGAKVIASSEFMKNLTALYLRYNKIGDVGAKDIAVSENMKNLTALNLRYNQISDDGAKDIAASKYLKNLTALDLNLNRIGDDGAKDIASSEFMKNLTALDLSGNQIGPAGAKDIASSENMKNLTALDLSCNQIGTAGAKDIAAFKYLRKTRVLL